MILITKSITYDGVYTIKGQPNYVVTNNGEIINVKTNHILKRQVKGYSIGYWIQKKFYTLSALRMKLEIIKEVECPF